MCIIYAAIDNLWSHGDHQTDIVQLSFHTFRESPVPHVCRIRTETWF